MLTTADVVKIITELGILFGVIGGVIVNIIVATRTREIHTLVNSNATIAQNKIEALTHEVASLRTIVAEQNTTAINLAAKKRKGD